MAATFRLTVLSSTTGAGAISVSPENLYGYYAEGALITVTVVPDDGYTFVNWKVDGVVQSTLASFVFTMPAKDVFLFAHYSGNYIPAFTYGTKYLSSYCTKGGTKTTRIEIQPKNYAGSSTVVPITDVSFRFGNSGSEIRKTIIGSSLDFSFPVRTIGDFNEFLTADLRAFRVVYYRGYVNASTYDFKWIGYLTTDVLEKPYLSPPFLISLTATDGLKSLEKPVNGFVASQLTAIQTITGALRQVFPDPLPVKEAVSVFETRMNNTGSLFNQYSHNSDLFFNKFQPFFYDNGGIKWNDTISIEKALIKILSPWVCRFFQWNGHWYILRLNELVKTSIKYSKFDAFGAFVSSENVTNSQTLTCLLFDRPIDTGDLGYTEFNASLILGDVDVPELNEILVEPFEGEGSWLSTDPIRWVLKRWQYIFCTAFDGVRDNDICRIEYISSLTDGTSGSYAQFWGTANGLSDPKLSYIESNKDSRIVGASVAIEVANTLSIGAKFQILRRGTADTSVPAAGSHLVGIAVQIGLNYLYETATPNVYGWTLTPTIITFPANNAGSFNTIKITNVVVPESGDVQFRLYQLITVSGTRHRYVIGWDDAYIQLEKNDGLVNEAILGKAVTATEYPSIAPDYETFIGDALTNLSSSAIRLNTVANSPVSKLWSRNGVEQLELLQIVLQDLANLEGKNNFRVRGTYHFNGMVDPTKAVIHNNRKYLVNSFVLDDWENSYSLDLFELGLVTTT